jgi:hypothetical protein
MLIALRSATSSSLKVKNYNTAASFSRRIMELNPKTEHKEQVIKVLRVCDTNRTNEVDLTYDERNPLVVCTKSFLPVYRGQPVARCGFNTAAFDPKSKGQVCPICEIGELGFQVTGITSVSSDASSQPPPQTQAQPPMQATLPPPTGLMSCRVSEVMTGSVANHTTERAHPMTILRKSPSVCAGGRTVQFINVSPGSREYNV